ncbi:2-iminobutanoate/2-iminopropanoate deaminase-like [Manduca sexta]|uniref:2-iminobutanoate/2-iminopropanoate deaminase-like n=1 Tax=Manduca sexta TaxID=7130 RepID=UPI0018905A51|nr:2-iminobutanoate/2-iminopropanoate deaminase-like [Manduca sexta]
MNFRPQRIVTYYRLLNMSTNGVKITAKADVVSKMSTGSKTNIHKVTKTISSPDVYKPVGPYSQAILADKTLYVSGVLGMDQQSQLVCGGAEAQTRQILTNLKHILEAGGASLESVIKTTILLVNMDDFQTVNKIYAEC